MSQTNTVSMRVQDIADKIGAKVIGDASVIISSTAAMDSAEPGSITYLKEKAYASYLEKTRASAVILREEYADQCPVTALVVDDPYVGYARSAQLLYPLPEVEGGRHANSVIDPSAIIEETAWIGPNVVIEAGVSIGERAYIGPGSVLREGCRIDEDTRLMAMIHIGRHCRVGKRGIIHPGAVIGADGFGFANDQGRWVKIPQIGTVFIGDDVEIGANTCIDCGAVHDTRIGNGVKIDNLVQIGHNAVIGDHSIIVATAGIGGSSIVGKHCAIAGGVGLAGHLELCDGVTVTGMSMVTHSVNSPGVYSSGISAQESRQWRRNHARLHQLDKTIKALKDELRHFRKESDKG